MIMVIMGWNRLALGFLLYLLITVTQSIKLPYFKDLTSQYPGYKHHGGKHNDIDIYGLIGHAPPSNLKHVDTSALRLSIAFNKLGGAHRMGTKEYHITKNNGRDSIKGRDGEQYVSKAIAYGPVLAMKYKSPELIHPDPLDSNIIYKKIQGRQGLIRMVTFRNQQHHADARILLWDCNQFYQAKDWFSIHHLISVEFWELPDSKCSSD